MVFLGGVQNSTPGPQFQPEPQNSPLSEEEILHQNEIESFVAAKVQELLDMSKLQVDFGICKLDFKRKMSHFSVRFFFLQEVMRSFPSSSGNAEDSAVVRVPTEEIEMVKNWVTLWLSSLLLAEVSWLFFFSISCFLMRIYYLLISLSSFSCVSKLVRM